MYLRPFFDYIGKRSLGIQMSVATASKPATARKNSNHGTQSKSLYASTQSRFSTSKLIQNLGSGNSGIQLSLEEKLRTVHGRD